MTILDFTKPHVLRDEEEYEAAVAEIDRLLDMDPPQGSEDYERLEFLSVLVEAYEDEYLPRYEDASPQEIVAFMLEQKEMTRADLAQWMGGRSRVSEFFNGVRPLSMRQVEVLKKQLGVPADLLIAGRDP